MQHPTKAGSKHRQKAGNLATSPLPGQKAMFGLNMPSPGERKAVGRVRATEQELCEETTCPVDFDEIHCCSVDCNRLERSPKRNTQGVIFQSTLKCAADKDNPAKVIGLVRRAV